MFIHVLRGREASDMVFPISHRHLPRVWSDIWYRHPPFISGFLYFDCYYHDDKGCYKANE